MATAVQPQPQQPLDDPNALPMAKPKPLPVQGTASAAPQLQLAPSQSPPPAAPPSRLDLANQAIETSAKATDPYYQKALKDATSQAAGAGRLMSGQLRTSLGDLARNRALELDTLRSNAITAATNSAMDDAFRTRDQGLAAEQLQLSRELGQGNLGIAQQQADTSRLGTTGNLELAKTGQAASIENQKAQLALQQKAAELDERVKTGQMTLAERDAALRELQNQQQYGLAGEQLDLAKAAQAQQASQFSQTLDFQKAQADIDNAYKAGQLSLAQRNQALAELAQQQQNELAVGQLDLAKQSQADQVALAKAQLTESARQFGLNQTQQMALAKLADATANRQIDVSTAQGKNALLVQLAQILGTSTTNIPPSFLEGILKSLGVDPQTTGTVVTVTNGNTGKPTGTTRTTTEGTGETTGTGFV